MFIPYTVDVPMKRLPIANWVLMVVTFCVSLGVWVKDSHRGRHGEIRMPPDLERRLEKLNRDPNPLPEEVERIEREIERLSQAIDDDAPTGALNPERFSVFQLISYQFVHGSWRTWFSIWWGYCGHIRASPMLPTWRASFSGSFSPSAC